MIKKRVKKIEEIDFNLYGISQESLDYFKKNKPHSFRESLAGRILVAEIAAVHKTEINDFLKQSLTSFTFKDFFWSMAHKNNFVSAGISDKPIGVDLEIIKKKDEILFDTLSEEEWEILGDKNWLNFYVGFSAKEAVLKLFSLEFDQLSHVLIRDKRDNNLILQHDNKEAFVNLEMQDDLVFAISWQNIEN